MGTLERFIYIAMIIVVFLYFGFNDCGNSNVHGKCAMKPCVRLVKRDFKYSVIMLLGLLILLITNHFGDNDKLLNYISFGSTLTSIILSVLAIFMTMLAESKSDETKTRLENLTTTIERVSETISRQARRISDIYTKMEERFVIYERMVKKQDEILERMAALQKSTKSIEEGIKKRSFKDAPQNSKQWINKTKLKEGNNGRH